MNKKNEWNTQQTQTKRCVESRSFYRSIDYNANFKAEKNG